MSTYMRALLDAGLSLTCFDEPAPRPDAPEPEATLSPPCALVSRDEVDETPSRAA